MKRRITAFVAAIGIAAALSVPGRPALASHTLTCTLVSTEDGNPDEVVFGPFTLTKKQLRQIQAAPTGTTFTINGYTIVKTGENTFEVTDPSGDTTVVTLVCA